MMTSLGVRTGRAFLNHLLKTLALLLAVSVIAFALVSASPVDPVQQYVLGVGGVSPEQRLELEEYWGVNDPPVQRYLAWLGALLHGDFGQSLLYRRPVLEVIGERFANSLALMLCAWLFSGLIGFGPGDQKNLLHPQQRPHLLAGAGVPADLRGVAGVVPPGVLHPHRDAQ